MPNRPKTAISFGVSFPRKVLDKIDSRRKDLPRSIYLRRLVQNDLANFELKSLGTSEVGPSKSLMTDAKITSTPLQEQKDS